MVRRLLALALAVASTLMTATASPLLMPTCDSRTTSGDCEEDGSSMLQTHGGIKKLKEPGDEELLAEEDEEEEEGEEKEAEAPPPPSS
mmetsp:Transcript_99566/g.223264  ORF Transcript_99566/g.223264 Transcript_99566/m.223264 type:complete len:88 (-) Transcript_99566:107-370(-)